MVKDMNVSPQVEALRSGKDAEGFRVQSSGPADSFFKEAGEKKLRSVLSG
jgi:hypothetical protein